MTSNDPKTSQPELHPRHQAEQPMLSPHRYKNRPDCEDVSLEEQVPETKIHGQPNGVDLLMKYLSTASDTLEKYLPVVRSALKQHIPTSREALDKQMGVLVRYIQSFSSQWVEFEVSKESAQYGAAGVGALTTLYVMFHALFGGPEDAIRVFAFGVVPTCFELEAPTNGSLEISYYYDDEKARAGDTAFYACDTGFTFAGDITDAVYMRACVGDAEHVSWNATAPTCELLSPYCPSLPEPAFGRVTYDPTQTFGTHAMYSCDPGYALSDDPNHLYELHQCVLDTETSGLWTGDDVECKVLEPYCPLPEVPANGDVTLTGLKLGDVATFSCDEMFSLSSDVNANVSDAVERVCEAGTARVGRWSGEQPECSQPFGNLPFDVAYIVNLPMRTERVMANLATVDIEPIKVEAVHYSRLNRHELESAGVIERDSALKMGEVACQMSHMKALETFLESNYETALIFEDDIAAPDANVVADMTHIAERLPSDWDVFNMMRCSDDCSRQEVVDDDLNLVRCYKPKCTSSVAFTRRAARIILERSPEPMESSYGAVIANLISDEQLVAYCAHNPRLFRQETTLLPSVIEQNPGPVPLPGQCYKLPPDTPRRMNPVE